MNVGFEYIEHEPLSIIDIKLHGQSISPQRLVEIAEQMRLELEKSGLVIQFAEPA